MIPKNSGDKKPNLFCGKKWTSVLNWDMKEKASEWYAGGKLNVTENCLDRQLDSRGDKTAIIWEPNNPKEKSRHISYRKLHAKVCQFTNALISLGIKKGDRVCLYMPMVPELTIALLACARIGAIHSVIFAGFSAKSLIDRINDAHCNLIITADGSFKGEKKST